MKKLLALLLALSLVFALFGCAAQESELPKIEPEVSAQPKEPQLPDESTPTDDTVAPAEDTAPAEEQPNDESALTVPDEGRSESWSGVIVDIFTEGGGKDSAQVVEVKSGEETVYFTLEQSSSCVRAAAGGEEESVAQSELVPGAQVEIEGRSFVGSGYHPISVIRILEEETVNVKPIETSPVSVQPTDEQPVKNTVAPLTEPPALTVINGSMQIEALRGGYEWECENADGTSTAVIADCAHPLDMQELVPALPCQPARAGSLDAHTAYLCFAVLPEKVTVRCWSTDCWGDNSAESDPVFVTLAGSELTLDDAFAGAYRIPLTENNCVFEVTASWSGLDGCGGSASYSFYTRWADAEIILPRVEVYDK